MSRVENGSIRSGVLSRSASPVERDVLNENAFQRMIAIERKRTERSKEPFLLMLLEAGEPQKGSKTCKDLDGILLALSPITRETDVIGWYKEHTAVAVMFTGLAESDRSTILGTILNRVSTALHSELPVEQLNQIRISFNFFPDHWNDNGSDRCGNIALYPDIANSEKGRRLISGVKRMMDIAGSAFLLLMCTPVFLVIATAIKLSSPGPVFFKQQRVGQYGRRFTFLKFRSMTANNDHSVHRQYVEKFIAGAAERVSINGAGESVYKLAHDNRVTAVGKLLRRTSLDELPQFLNVLSGDMSLVGPRPPIPYELAAYQTWHRRRLLQVKPGITGLWQVTGRSRVSFDDMVRLDLHYATSWSPWLDFKILMRTPAAVIKGAY